MHFIRVYLASLVKFDVERAGGGLHPFEVLLIIHHCF
jgi:hypothetical protein